MLNLASTQWTFGTKTEGLQELATYIQKCQNQLQEIEISVFHCFMTIVSNNGVFHVLFCK